MPERNEVRFKTFGAILIKERGERIFHWLDELRTNKSGGGTKMEDGTKNPLRELKTVVQMWMVSMGK